ncbi:IclR family transcriptional regulator [Indiicoccus explosivorum]|uniref:IclR family transcriptional regulator n=1 Tax=Indiicoccus explosivorum TaxID=1917864 RepID=UPI000B441330|nr:IclR family transcriptional regulator [Indiicoccus explosivorum]
MENSKNLRQSSDFIQSLERGLQVIQAFSEETPKLTVSQAAKITGLSRPAVRRILLTLEALGFTESANGIYSLTARTLTLGYAYISSQNIWNIAVPIMREFVEKTGESCSISVLDGAEVIYVARVPANRIMSISLDVGSRLPAYASSMGQMLLACLPEEELHKVLDETPFKKYTENTIADKESMMEELDKVRERGWAGVDQQLEQGLRSIAVPIRRGDGSVIAAINCSAHAGRVSRKTLREEFLPLLRETSDRITQAVSISSGSSLGSL